MASNRFRGYWTDGMGHVQMILLSFSSDTVHQTREFPDDHEMISPILNAKPPSIPLSPSPTPPSAHRWVREIRCQRPTPKRIYIQLQVATAVRKAETAITRINVYANMSCAFDVRNMWWTPRSGSTKPGGVSSARDGLSDLRQVSSYKSESKLPPCTGHAGSFRASSSGY